MPSQTFSLFLKVAQTPPEERRHERDCRRVSVFMSEEQNTGVISAVSALTANYSLIFCDISEREQEPKNGDRFLKIKEKKRKREILRSVVNHKEAPNPSEGAPKPSFTN